MTRAIVELPIQLTRAEELPDALALAREAKALLELCEAQIAALELALAFERHSELQEIWVEAPAKTLGRFAPGALLEVATNLSEAIDELSRERRHNLALERGLEGQGALDDELEALSEAQRAGARWALRLSPERAKRLIGSRIARPAAGSDFVSHAMAALLTPAEFGAWQAAALGQSVASAPAQTPKTL